MSAPESLPATEGSMRQPCAPALSAPRCEKCGSDDVLTRWHGEGAYHETRTQGDSCRSDYGPNKGEPTVEHLHYRCRNCQWNWTGKLTPNLVSGPFTIDLTVTGAKGEFERNVRWSLMYADDKGRIQLRWHTTLTQTHEMQPDEVPS